MPHHGCSQQRYSSRPHHLRAVPTCAAWSALFFALITRAYLALAYLPRRGLFPANGAAAVVAPTLVASLLPPPSRSAAGGTPAFTKTAERAAPSRRRFTPTTSAATTGLSRSTPAAGETPCARATAGRARHRPTAQQCQGRRAVLQWLQQTRTLAPQPHSVEQRLCTRVRLGPRCPVASRAARGAAAAAHDAAPLADAAAASYDTTSPCSALPPCRAGAPS